MKKSNNGSNSFSYYDNSSNDVIDETSSRFIPAENSNQYEIVSENDHSDSLNSSSEEIIDNLGHKKDILTFGSLGMENLLNKIAEINNWKPITNLLDFCKNIYINKFGKGRITIGDTIAFTINPKSSQDECLTGFYLTFTMIYQLSSKLNKESVKLEDQMTILQELYNKIIEKYPFTEYQMKYFYHTHPYFAIPNLFIP